MKSYFSTGVFAATEPMRPAGAVAAASPEPTLTPPTRYPGAWPELLSDLAVLPPVWVETAGAGVRVAQRTALGGLRVHGQVGYLDATSRQIRVLLDGCHAIRALDADLGLALEDMRGRVIATMQLDAAWHPFSLRVLVSTLGASAGNAVQIHRPRAGRSLLASVERHPVTVLQRDLDALRPDLGFLDVAEISGRLSMQPARVREAAARRGVDVIAVDPVMVTCALEALVDQVHTLALTTGSDAWVTRSIAQLYGHKREGGRLFLRGDDIRMELEVDAIDSAWVIDARDNGVRTRMLRLYDADGRAIALIEDAEHAVACRPATHAERSTEPLASAKETKLWATLMNALVS
jgi:hypothetical protein